jgi:hypothetical protein
MRSSRLISSLLILRRAGTRDGSVPHVDFENPLDRNVGQTSNIATVLVALRVGVELPEENPSTLSIKFQSKAAKARSS